MTKFEEVKGGQEFLGRFINKKPVELTRKFVFVVHEKGKREVLGTHETVREAYRQILQDLDKKFPKKIFLVRRKSVRRSK